jgi:hypothetical protein
VRLRRTQLLLLAEHWQLPAYDALVPLYYTARVAANDDENDDDDDDDDEGGASAADGLTYPHFKELLIRAAALDENKPLQAADDGVNDDDDDVDDDESGDVGGDDDDGDDNYENDNVDDADVGGDAGTDGFAVSESPYASFSSPPLRASMLPPLMAAESLQASLRKSRIATLSEFDVMAELNVINDVPLGAAALVAAGGGQQPLCVTDDEFDRHVVERLLQRRSLAAKLRRVFLTYAHADGGVVGTGSKNVSVVEFGMFCSDFQVRLAAND